MLSTPYTFTLDGVGARRVRVEVDVHRGLPGFAVVGLPDPAVRETRERVRAALVDTGFEFPLHRIVVNLAPASLRKAGSGMDLAIAAGILVASGQVDSAAVEGTALVGELGLDGGLRPVPGALVIAEAALEADLRALVVPAGNGREAALAGGGTQVVAMQSVGELSLFGAGLRLPDPTPTPAPPRVGAMGGPDLADLRGMADVRLALEVAAAGGHSLLMIGPPGAGMSLAASRLPSILPPIDGGEALEVARILSATGRLEDGALPSVRPFRAPHHTISAAKLLGGGTPPRPGEATLAHRGVLFLDDLAEFRRDVLEGLRTPLRRGEVRVTGVSGTRRLPSRFLLVAASDPCPCGRGRADDDCTCRPEAIERHRGKLRAALGRRFDLIVEVEPPSSEVIAGPPGESSQLVRDRVCRARARQAGRLGRGRCAAETNSVEALTCETTPGAGALLADLADRRNLGPRARDRVVAVARTLADLTGTALIEEPAVWSAFRLSEGVRDLR